jgi:alpha-L-fucosidase 2
MLPRGETPIRFFKKAEIKDPIISSSANLNEVVLETSFMYDLPTEAGKTYTLVSADDL